MSGARGKRPRGNGRSPEASPPSAPAPEALARAEVLTPDGELVRIGDLWKTRPVVLAFVRHFG